MPVMSRHISNAKLRSALSSRAQVGPNPDASAGPTPHELQHHGGAVLHRPHRERADRQHHPLHPQDGVHRLQPSDHHGHLVMEQYAI